MSEYAASRADDVSRRWASRVLPLICLLAVALRGYLAATAVAISVDSALFIDYAQHLASEPLAAMRHYDQHPVYPALILLFRQCIGRFLASGNDGWILAGRLAAITGSVAAVCGMYWLTRRLYDRRCGLIAAALLALLPDACQFGGDVLSDLPHLAFYLLGMAAIVAGCRRGRTLLFVLSVGLAALAFLTRPEGGAVLAVGVVTVLFRSGRTIARRFTLAGFMLIVFFALTGPYQIVTGKLVPKKPLWRLFQFSEGEANFSIPSRVLSPPKDSDRGLALAPHARFPAFHVGHGGPTLRSRRTVMPGRDREAALAVVGGSYRSLALSARMAGHGSFDRSLALAARVAGVVPVPIELLYQWFRAGRVVYVLLAIIGLVVWRPRGIRGRILGGAIGIHIVVLIALSMSYGYLDRRHALVLAALSLPLAAAGIWWLAWTITGRVAERRVWRTRAIVMITGFCAACTAPWLLRPINVGEEHVIGSANWLRANTPTDMTIVGDRRMHRVAVHADRPFQDWVEFRQHKRPAYFVVDAEHIDDPARNPQSFDDPAALARRLAGTIELVHTEQTLPFVPHRTEFRIYRYLPN